MKTSLVARYILFMCVFVLVILGLIFQSYTVLAITIVFAVILGVAADKIENRATEPFKHLNKLHAHGRESEFKDQ